MFSKWRRVAPMALVSAFMLCADDAGAQEENREGFASTNPQARATVTARRLANRGEGVRFIPAPNQPCRVGCPDPGAPLSRVNYPPRDDNFLRMFVATEKGLEFVKNPHWNGAKAAAKGEWCGPLCRDPYAPISVANQLRRNDAHPYMFRFFQDRATLRISRNPHWVERANDEAMEAATLYPPLPLLGLGSSGTEAGPGAGETRSKIVSGSVNRTGIAYHATGNDVFRPVVLQNIGGVLSQGSVAAGPDGQAPKVEFLLGPDGAYPGYLLVSDGAARVRYRIGYDDLVPMALFVDGGGTSLYTLWGADKLPANFQREAGFAKFKAGRGFVAIEFAATRYADALYFMDTCAGCVAFPDVDPAESGTEAGSRRRSSYINADVGSQFEVKETGAGAIEVTGSIVRFHWSADAGTGKRVSVNRKQPVVRPGELQANVGRWLAENEKAHVFRLMLGIDVRKEGSVQGRRRLADAFFLFETLALLRASKTHWPEDWSAFMAVLSSQWLVRNNREPWERYTKTYCGVYPTGVECANRDQP